MAEFVWLGPGGGSGGADSWLGSAVTAQVAPPLTSGYGFVDSHLVHAGRLGLFLTFVNLLPAWPFDGALLAQALLGRRRIWLAGGVAAALLAAAAATRDPGWLVGAGLCVLPQRRPVPPLNPFQGLGALRWILGVGALLLAVACASSVRPLISGW